MPITKATSVFQKMNEWFAECRPFFFIIDYKGENGDICTLEDLCKENIYPSSPIFHQEIQNVASSEKFIFKKFPESFESYSKKFYQVISDIKKGNSYLINLTCCTPIEYNGNFPELYTQSQSKYKLLYQNNFIHFSPETFIRIENDQIETFPMKGTIDASIPNAEQLILQNNKEKNEQYIITDLLRNDLSIVAKNVTVKRFRYVERIETNHKPLLQISTHITGQLKEEYKNNPGNIFQKLLPAGSICGAPKTETLKIIDRVEDYKRGFYTGVWGIFDGKRLDSCVIIRMLEKIAEGYVFKSGGGITASSDANQEYQEMIDKIYVPIH